jgi:hypothetical protein
MKDSHIYLMAIAHETNQPIGGTKMLYRLVDTLNDSGFSASILHREKGFRYTWFENQTKISYVEDCLVKLSDFVVIPEALGVNIVNICPEISIIIYNQNCCIVIGYNGGGAREYLTEEFSFPIEVDDILGFAKTVEEVIYKYEQNPNFFQEERQKAAQFIKDTYSKEKAKQPIVDCWNNILSEDK